MKWITDNQMWATSLFVVLAAVGVRAEPIPVPLRADPDSESASVAENGVWHASGLAGSATTQGLAVVQAPVVEGPVYSVVGELSYEGVDGRGYLVMWNQIPERGRFFTKTLNHRGPMGVITGSSDWRPFSLPFHRGDEAAPDMLEVQLVLPGSGRVMVRDLRLVPDGDGSAWLYPAGWWSLNQARFVNGAIGVVFGLLGAMMGLTASRPGWGRVTIAIALAITGLGLVALVAGCAALLSGQPAHVLTPVGLTAVLGAILGPYLFRQTRRRQTEAELRRMEAHDLAQA